MGWLPAFVYIAGAALRLARFNTNIGIVDKRYLPRPAQSGCRGAGDGADLGAGRCRFQGGDARWAGSAWTAFAVTLYAGPDDGDQRAVLQLQGRRLPGSTVPFIVIVAIALGIALISHPSADSAFRAVLRLWRLRLRGLWLAPNEGQAGQRDSHIHRRTG
jgi:CDP-diacylglycerol--serine O-phosphatidyltransferase